MLQQMVLFYSFFIAEWFHHEFPWWPGGKECICQAGDMGLTPGSGRTPGEGNGTPLQYSCWKVPWTEQSGGLQSMGLNNSGT